jgi:hypothetical protein
LRHAGRDFHIARMHAELKQRGSGRIIGANTRKNPKIICVLPRDS